MKKITILKAAFALAAIMFIMGSTAGTQRLMAQHYGPGQCDPCQTWWVDVNYVFPPCFTGVPIDVYWDNGLWSHDIETTDGHHIYNVASPGPIPPLPPPARATSVSVLGINVIINGPPVWIPYDCDGDGQPEFCLKVEVRCNPCLEIKLHLEPCP